MEFDSTLPFQQSQGPEATYGYPENKTFPNFLHSPLWTAPCQLLDPRNAHSLWTWDVPHTDNIQKKFQQETGLPAATQELQPTNGAAVHLPPGQFCLCRPSLCEIRLVYKIQDLYRFKGHQWPDNISADSTHPGHKRFPKETSSTQMGARCFFPLLQNNAPNICTFCIIFILFLMSVSIWKIKTLFTHTILTSKPILKIYFRYCTY